MAPRGSADVTSNREVNKRGERAESELVRNDLIDFSFFQDIMGWQFTVSDPRKQPNGSNLYKPAVDFIHLLLGADGS